MKIISFRRLLYISFVVLLNLQIINCDQCEEISSDCEWDDREGHYMCNIFGTPSDVITMRLQLSHHVTDTGALYQYHAAKLYPEMDDIKLFWNHEYVLLSVSGSTKCLEYH